MILLLGKQKKHSIIIIQESLNSFIKRGVRVEHDKKPNLRLRFLNFSAAHSGPMLFFLAHSPDVRGEKMKAFDWDSKRISSRIIVKRTIIQLRCARLQATSNE